MKFKGVTQGGTIHNLEALCTQIHQGSDSALDETEINKTKTFSKTNHNHLK